MQFNKEIFSKLKNIEYNLSYLMEYTKVGPIIDNKDTNLPNQLLADLAFVISALDTMYVTLSDIISKHTDNKN
jgi:hypothetical protein